MLPTYIYRATTHRLLDADTFELAIDLGFKVTVTEPIRLHGVDCPEISTPEGRLAHVFATKILRPEGSPATPLVVQTQKTRAGSDVQSFARFVADIWLPDGILLANVLLEAGHAVPMKR